MTEPTRIVIPGTEINGSEKQTYQNKDIPDASIARMMIGPKKTVHL